MPGHVLDPVDRAQEVDLQDLFPVLAVLFLQPGHLPGNAGVIDQDIDPAVGAEAQVDKALDLLLHRYVHLPDHRLPAGRLYPGQGFLKPVFLHIGQNQFGSLPGKEHGRGPADAAGPPL